MTNNNFTIKLFGLIALVTTISSCQSSQGDISDSLSNSSSNSTTVSSIESSSLNESSSQILSYSIYKNPVYDFDFPDPTIVKHSDGYYYAFCTGTRIIKSLDLVEWESVGIAISVRPTWGSSGASMWAPDVIFIKGQYVMYYSLSKWDDPNPGIGLATAPHPTGPWTDLGKFFLSDEIGVNNSIDPQAFIDVDGRVYLIWGSFRGIYAIELTDDGLDFKDGSVGTANENKTRLAGFETSRPLEVNTFEAAYIIYRNNYYYLFLSNGQCCSGSYSYNVRVARAESVLGPYTDANQRSMLSGDVGTYVVFGNNQFAAPGHNSIVQDDVGNDWMLYHAYVGENRNKRVLMLDKLLWDENGFPYLLGTTPSNNRKKGPELYL